MMSTTYPGTTIEVSKISKGSSRQLFEGVFATGGITLSQVSIMTGLEPYMIQNWVKRGFVSSPKKRVYTPDQFARIVIINMLKDSLQIDRICGIIKMIGGHTESKEDDMISDSELYHMYVDMLAGENVNMSDDVSVEKAADAELYDYHESIPGSKKKLRKILKIMAYAHTASSFCKRAEDILSSLD